MALHVPFTKIEGAQNDFIVIDNRELFFPRESMKAFSALACHRRKGIGADGVIFIDPHVSLDFTMLFFNPDGSDGSMCGNGGRCAALFAVQHQLAGKRQAFEVLGMQYNAEIHDGTIRIYFPPPKKLRFSFSLNVFDQRIITHYAHVGAPHAMIFIGDIVEPLVTSLEALNVDAWGRAVRTHPEFQPEGVNANFLSIDAEGIVQLRTFEKGVEAETEACGTGTIASALTAHFVKGLQPPITVRTHGGDVLTVGFDVVDATVQNLFLEGPAREVFSGSILYDPIAQSISPPMK